MPRWWSPTFVYLGRISYGLYVFHAFGLQWMLHLVTMEHPGLAWAARFTGALTLTVLLASLSYFLLEMPFLRLKGRFTYVRSRPDSDPVVVPDSLAPVPSLVAVAEPQAAAASR